LLYLSSIAIQQQIIIAVVSIIYINTLVA